MKDNPLVSVIIPNYNHSRYLKKRIDSVINQTYQNIEIILLDDCSTDDSISVIESYSTHPKIAKIIYNKENSGSTFKQWYNGIQEAKGDLLWIAESDDYADVCFLEKLVPFFTSYGVVIAFCASNFVYSDGCIRCVQQFEKTNERVILPSSDFIIKFLSVGGIGNISASVFDLNVVKKIPISYVDYKATGDHLFTIFVTQNGNGCFFNQSLNFCRIHSDSVTPKSVKSGLTFVEERRTYNYLMSKRLIIGWHWVYVNYKYLEWILSTEFDSIDIKTRVLSLWNPFALLPPRVSLKILRILKTIHYDKSIM